MCINKCSNPVAQRLLFMVKKLFRLRFSLRFFVVLLHHYHLKWFQWGRKSRKSFKSLDFRLYSLSIHTVNTSLPSTGWINGLNSISILCNIVYPISPTANATKWQSFLLLISCSLYKQCQFNFRWWLDYI